VTPWSASVPCDVDYALADSCGAMRLCIGHALAELGHPPVPAHLTRR